MYEPECKTPTTYNTHSYDQFPVGFGMQAIVSGKQAHREIIDSPCIENGLQMKSR